MAIEENIQTIVGAFKKNLKSVEELVNFDREVLDFAITSISTLKEKLKKHHKLDNPHLTAQTTLSLLKNVKKNDSLRPRYKTIFNQGLVLLVSYFGSTVSELFKHSASIVLKSNENSRLLKEEIKLSLQELHDMNFDLRESIGDILVLKKDMSFQDMKSISRCFKSYFDIDIEKDSDVNNIIFGQACRHSIVHAGGIVDDRLVHQVSSAFPRDIKNSLTEGAKLAFNPKELKIISESMMKYVESLGSKLGDSLKSI